MALDRPTRQSLGLFVLFRTCRFAQHLTHHAFGQSHREACAVLTPGATLVVEPAAFRAVADMLSEARDVLLCIPEIGPAPARRLIPGVCWRGGRWRRRRTSGWTAHVTIGAVLRGPRRWLCCCRD